MDVDTMQLELLRLRGWAYEEGDGWSNRDGRFFTGDSLLPEAIETLDGLAALWPEGWEWHRYSHEWCAFQPSVRPQQPDIIVPDTGDELADRLALTIAVLTRGQA